MSKGPPTPAEIKFARLYAEGTLSGQECARQAGVATGTSAGTGARVRRLKDDPRILAEINLFRLALAEATGFDANTLAAGFYERIMVDQTAIHNDNGNIRPKNEWPEVLGRMARLIHWDPETGRIIRVRFQDTSHLDTILAPLDRDDRRTPTATNRPTDDNDRLAHACTVYRERKSRGRPDERSVIAPLC